ncbi:AAA family ATPase, partial [Salinispora arenicola]|nr:AAA family ATPase [Salinispora arenicola]
NELTPGQIIVVDCDGDPTNIDTSTLTFHGTDKPATPGPIAGIGSVSA